MKECFSTLPLRNKKNTTKYSTQKVCKLCDDRYNCLLVSSVQTETNHKQWVIDLMNDVKEDITSEYVLEKIRQGNEDVAQDPIVKEHFLSMVRDQYKKLKSELDSIKDGMREIGIDIEKELEEKKQDGGLNEERAIND